MFIVTEYAALITNALTMSVETLIVTSTGTVSEVTLRYNYECGNYLIGANFGTMKTATT